MKTQAVIPSAGTGSRLKIKQDKPLVLLNGKPLFIYALLAMEKVPRVDSVILVANKKHLKVFEQFIKKFKLKKVKRIVAGGATRCASVKKALAVLDADTEVIMIHDGARPFIKPALIAHAVSLMNRESAVVVGVPVKPTIKKVNSNLYVEETLPRETLWEIQTPQIFRKEILLKAHELMPEKNPTDDAVLVEKMGVKVKMVMGDYRNIKITTREDLAIARMFLES